MSNKYNRTNIKIHKIALKFFMKQKLKNIEQPTTKFEFTVVWYTHTS